MKNLETLLKEAFMAGTNVSAYCDVYILLYEVKPTNSDVLLATLFAIAAITAMAAIMPVARALRIEPMAVLKVD